MARTSGDNYPVEVKRSAIKRVTEGGRGSITAVAKELGCAKSTVDYWLKNANRIMGIEVDTGKNSIISQIKNQYISKCWRHQGRTLEALSKKTDDATYAELSQELTRNTERLIKLEVLVPNGGDDELNVIKKTVVSQERRVHVQSFMEKQQRVSEEENKPNTDEQNSGVEHEISSNEAGPKAEAEEGQEA